MSVPNSVPIVVPNGVLNHNTNFVIIVPNVLNLHVRVRRSSGLYHIEVCEDALGTAPAPVDHTGA